MSQSKRLLVTMEKELYDDVRKKSKKIMGRENVSGLINVLLQEFVTDEQK